MEVHCEFLDQHTTDSTSTIAGRTINANGVGNFAAEVKHQLTGVNTIVLEDDMEMIVVGGRHSICQAFATNPVAQYIFAAPPGKVIYAAHASSSRKGWAFGMGAIRGLQIATGPVAALLPTVAGTYNNGNPLMAGARYVGAMRHIYSPKLNRGIAGVLNEASKTRTVLRLFSESSNFGGHVLGNRLNGANISLELSKFFV